MKTRVLLWSVFVLIGLSWTLIAIEYFILIPRDIFFRPWLHNSILVIGGLGFAATLLYGLILMGSFQVKRNTIHITAKIVTVFISACVAIAVTGIAGFAALFSLILGHTFIENGKTYIWEDSSRLLSLTIDIYEVNSPFTMIKVVDRADSDERNEEAARQKITDLSHNSSQADDFAGTDTTPSQNEVSEPEDRNPHCQLGGSTQQELVDKLNIYDADAIKGATFYLPLNDKAGNAHQYFFVEHKDGCMHFISELPVIHGDYTRGSMSAELVYLEFRGLDGEKITIKSQDRGMTWGDVITGEPDGP